MNQPLIDTKASAQRTTALRFDIIAGLTAAAVVLPKAMAYATLRALMEAERRVTDRGATAWLVASLAERLGRERMLFNARAGIERYQGDDDGKEKRSE